MFVNFDKSNKLWFANNCISFLIEKRAKFDQGEDPLDPEAQNRNPFQGGFQDGDPFGGFGGFGQGFQFKFHFN